MGMALGLLVIGNALGEMVSYNRLINANSVLFWLDQLGRR
jgi:hypothetical protein